MGEGNWNSFFMEECQLIYVEDMIVSGGTKMIIILSINSGKTHQGC